MRLEGNGYKANNCVLTCSPEILPETGIIDDPNLCIDSNPNFGTNSEQIFLQMNFLRTIGKFVVLFLFQYI